MTIVYSNQDAIDPTELITLLRSGGFNRPMGDPSRVGRMLDNADIVITARHEGMLVGFIRGLTDHAYYALVAELAVNPAHKGTGIGRDLLQRFREASGEQCHIVLASSEEGHTFYQHLGWEPLTRGWRLPRSL